VSSRLLLFCFRQRKQRRRRRDLPKNPGHRLAGLFFSREQAQRAGLSRLGVHDFRRRRAGSNFDAARLLRLGDLAHEVDVQQSIH
jgi:hypothetical protein